MTDPQDFAQFFDDQTKDAEKAGLAHGLADNIWEGMAHARGFTDSGHMRAHDLNSRAMGLQERYKGQPGKVVVPGDDDPNGDEPYYEIHHPHGWVGRSYGGPYLEVSHRATPDEAHDAIDVGHLAEGDYKMHPSYTDGTPEENHAALSRELHHWATNYGKDYADNIPKIKRWQQVRGLYGKTAKEASMHKQAHDSGDGQTIYHCPFCGSGQVIARSDRTIECEFCHTAFTVQVQPQYSAFPQTIDGMPVQVPGMPGQVGPDPMAPPMDGPDDQGGQPFPPDGDEDDADPDADPDADEDDGGNPFAKNSVLRDQAGRAFRPDDYVTRLALSVTDNRDAVLARARSLRGNRG